MGWQYWNTEKAKKKKNKNKDLVLQDILIFSAGKYAKLERY